ncbi:ABC transporter ATP-binding protein [Acinetobacter populi]|uniref:Iron ABC transporter n=1 Tax=Acinetobacter populi TaxID=1582270 RepID=A0A1Z9YZQ0_9GAMM|nr:ABC transporter ATP-binding protein [Acinetobacter populi]OUY07657.1 iron ABC transporter [Acinetobacter populi]
MTAIQVKHVNFSYAAKSILQDINIDFAAHRFSVLLGRNGSGKSTLFNLLAGIYPIQQGEILLSGRALTQYQGIARAKQLGFLAQSHQSLFNFKVMDVVLTGRAAFNRFAPNAEDHHLAELALKNLEIEHLAKRDYTTLSGGERQLVMIARILTQNPKVILLDEPTNHLDVYYQVYLMEKLKHLSEQGYTIISIMHDPNLAFLYADDFYFIKNQKIIQPDLVQSVSDPVFLQQVYDISFQQIQIGRRHIVMPQSKSN